PSQRLLLRKGRTAIPKERRRNDQIAAERLRLAEQGEGRKSTTERIADQHTLSWIERILLLEMRDDLAKQRIEISRRSARAERQRLAQARGQISLGGRVVAKSSRSDIRIGVTNRDQVAERQCAT